MLPKVYAYDSYRHPTSPFSHLSAELSRPFNGTSFVLALYVLILRLRVGVESALRWKYCVKTSRVSRPTSSTIRIMQALDSIIYNYVNICIYYIYIFT